MFSLCQPSQPFPSRNAFLLFRRRFDLAQIPNAAPFHLFADTRYRLSVNGRIVASGPTRFYPQFPLYDSHDIAPFLRAGANEIRVEVNHRGAPSFQAVPSQCGFAAWDEFGADLQTPGAWQAKVSRAWNPNAPLYSFAQGPVEIFDVAALQDEWRDENSWQTPVVAPEYWGELKPRDIAPLPNRVLVAPTLARRTIVDSDEISIGFHRVFAADARDKSPRDRFIIALILDSPRAQTVELGLFWGEHFLNGDSLETRPDATRGNRRNATAQLRAGANLLWADLEVLMPSWGFALSWPRASQLTLAAPILASAATSPDELARRCSHAARVPADLALLDWLRPLGEFEFSDFPARQVAWETAAKWADFDAGRTPLVGAGENAAIAVWDFRKTVLGHVRLSLECETETIVDVTFDERLRADGALDIYATNPFVNNVDRYVLSAGRHQIEGFHARGGRYLQLSVRSRGSVKSNGIEVRSAVTHLGESGDFECSDALLNQIWRVGRATVEACWPDVWVDCPWREQGAYVGDTLVEFGAAQMLSSDRQTMRRALQLWAQGQRADGQMPSCVPAWMTSSHADFTLIYVLALRDYFAATGDAEFVAQVWPAVERIWNSPRWKGADGLWDADAESHLFLDWSIPLDQRLGESNGALNALRVGALEATAQLAAALGRDAQPWQAQRQDVIAAMRAQLWRPQTQDFAAYLGDESPAYHANIWALRFGVAANEAGVLKRVRAALQMFENPDDLEARGGHPELYFCHYVLQALCARGLHAEALDLVRRAWSPMIGQGAVTFWERLYLGAGRCGQSVSRVELRADLVSGPRSVGFASGLRASRRVYVSRARLRFGMGTRRVSAHARGPIKINWRRENGEVRAEISAPDGVTVAD